MRVKSSSGDSSGRHGPGKNQARVNQESETPVPKRLHRIQFALGLLALHRIEEFFVGLGVFELVEDKLRSLHIFHRGE